MTVIRNKSLLDSHRSHHAIPYTYSRVTALRSHVQNTACDVCALSIRILYRAMCFHKYIYGFTRTVAGHHAVYRERSICLLSLQLSFPRHLYVSLCTRSRHVVNAYDLIAFFHEMALERAALNDGDKWMAMHNSFYTIILLLLLSRRLKKTYDYYYGPIYGLIRRNASPGATGEHYVVVNLLNRHQ